MMSRTTKSIPPPKSSRAPHEGGRPAPAERRIERGCCYFHGTPAGEPYIELLRRGPFSRLWWASAASSLGDWVSFFATLALASHIGGSTAALVPLMSRIIPGLLFGSLAGVVADRLDRKWVMVLSDAGRGLVVIWLAAADDLVQIAVISSILEILTMIRQPAREAAVPTLVDRADLVRANSFSAAAAYGTAPLGAGVWAGLAALFAVAGGWGFIDRGPDLAFAFDTVTFLVSGAIVASIPIPKPTLAGQARKRSERTPSDQAAPEEEESSAVSDWRRPLRDLAEGFTFVTQTRTVRRVVFGMALALFGGSALLPLGQTFAQDVLGAGDSGFGVLVTALGVGVGAGMLGVAVFADERTRHDLTYAVSLCATGPAIVLAAFSRTVVGASGWLLAAGAGTGFAYVMGFTHLHGVVDDTLRGRTFAALFTLVRSAMMVSFTVAVLAAGALDGLAPAPFDNGIRNVFGLAGALIFVTGLVSMAAIRSGLIRSDLPPHLRRSLKDTSKTFDLMRGARRHDDYRDR